MVEISTSSMNRTGARQAAGSACATACSMSWRRPLRPGSAGTKFALSSAHHAGCKSPCRRHRRPFGTPTGQDAQGRDRGSSPANISSERADRRENACDASASRLRPDTPEAKRHGDIGSDLAIRESAPVDKPVGAAPGYWALRPRFGQRPAAAELDNSPVSGHAFERDREFRLGQLGTVLEVMRRRHGPYAQDRHRR